MHVQLRAKPRRSLLLASVGVDGLEVVTHLRPLQRVADTVDDVVLRLPGQQACRAVDPGISAGRVTWPPSGLESADRTVRYAVEHAEKFSHRGAAAGAEVDGGRRSRQAVEPGQRGDVRGGQIPDVD